MYVGTRYPQHLFLVEGALEERDGMSLIYYSGMSTSKKQLFRSSAH